MGTFFSSAVLLLCFDWIIDLSAKLLMGEASNEKSLCINFGKCSEMKQFWLNVSNYCAPFLQFCIRIQIYTVAKSLNVPESISFVSEFNLKLKNGNRGTCTSCAIECILRNSRATAFRNHFDIFFAENQAKLFIEHDCAVCGHFDLAEKTFVCMHVVLLGSIHKQGVQFRMFFRRSMMPHDYYGSLGERYYREWLQVGEYYLLA